MDVVEMWVTADGHIRQELRADGRYDEARGTRSGAYTGHYTVAGNYAPHTTRPPSRSRCDRGGT